MVVKGPPWMPRTNGTFDPFWSFVDEDMQLLHDNGLNAIRCVVRTLFTILNVFIKVSSRCNDLDME